MPPRQPIVTAVSGKRQFVCSAVALQAVIVNAEGCVLLLSSPLRNPDGAWQVISGALEAEETILQGILRETHEEVGPQVQVRPLGTVHVHTFKYDEHVPHMIGVYYLLAYEGGPIQPGDDMHGSQFRWWSMDALRSERVILHIPRGQKWVLHRAVELYRLWKDREQPEVDLNL